MENDNENGRIENEQMLLLHVFLLFFCGLIFANAPNLCDLILFVNDEKWLKF